MKKTILTLAAVTLSVGALVGCDSNNIQPYNPNNYLLTTNQIQNTLKNKVNVGQFVMPEGDQNSLLCRLGAHIYLPNKMTYSQFIKQAMEVQLLASKRYQSTSTKTISANISKVMFSSINGTWTINSTVSVNNGSPIPVNTVTQFGTSYIGVIACKNVTNSFDTAVRNYIAKVFNTPAVKSALNAPVKAKHGK